jgi:[protein-PII] uridylyltransferase
MNSSTPEILSTLRALFAEKHHEIRIYHSQGGAGTRVVESLSDLADQVLLTGYQSIDPALIQGWGGTLVAIGGYGRRELSPGSDIDLMFLYPAGRDKEAQSLSSELLRLFWDIGYKVGHSVRNVEECVSLARQDALIATSLLESRLLTGDRNLFHLFHEAFFSKIVDKNLRAFLLQLNQGREDGRREYGATPYLLEPNLKQSPGGLRDLHHLKWVALARYRTNQLPQLFQWGLLSNPEYSSLVTAQDLLWRIRNQLHFMAGKASDHLTIELQEEAARFFHLENRRELMRQYYILTGRISEISQRFIRDAFPVSRWQKWNRSWKTRQVFPGFQISAGELTIQHSNLFQFFEKDENILRLFLLAKEHSARISDSVLEVLSQLAEQSKEVPLSSEAFLLFKELLSRPGRIAETLRVMHRTHILWRIIPEFSHANRLVQESRSHFYTVDEHSFRAVEEAEHLLDEEGPLKRIYAGISRKDLLHLALLLHDIGKGMEGDHSRIGAEIAEKVGTLLKYNQEERSLLTFLVRRHLVLSEVALYRDFSNEPVLLQFAKEVARPETLKKLFILTCSDIRAVGPGTWTSWKGELLLKLYQESLQILAGEESDPADQKIASIIGKVRDAVRGKYPTVWLDETLSAFLPRYLLVTPFDKILIDLAALFRLLINPVQIEAHYLSERGVTEYTFYTFDTITPGLFSKMAGVLAAKGLQIMAAQVFTQSNGTVVDTFLVVDPDYPGVVPLERIAAITDEVRAVLTGKETIENLFKKGHRFTLQKGSPPTHQPVRVELDNDSSSKFTIIDIFAPDRRGLLYLIAKTIFELDLSVHSAKIATRLDQIVDVFYVQGPDQAKITDADRMREVKTRLTDQIEQIFSNK